jgi:hypothetical protein
MGIVSTIHVVFVLSVFAIPNFGVLSSLFYTFADLKRPLKWVFLLVHKAKATIPRAF